jgi:type 1 glutamine amidotransferase
MTGTAEKRALVVRGGWDGHFPVETTDAFIPFLAASGFDVRVEESAAVFLDADYLATVDLILECSSMGEIEDAELAALIGAVAAGTGLAGWHGGIVDPYRSKVEYLHLIGGQFAHHPGVAEAERTGRPSDVAVRHTIEIVPAQAQHPIVAGIDDFELVTEQYWVLTDDYNDVLATMTLAARDFDAWHRPVTVPAVWTRAWGAGKIFVATPGHDTEVLADPNVRTIVERGLLWAAR